MNIQKRVCTQAAILTLLGLSACTKNTPPEAPTQSDSAAESEKADPTKGVELQPVVEQSSEDFVEGVAGGTLLKTIELQAVVVSVDQEKREAVLRGPEGGEVAVRVGKDAVNFYQVKPGARVNVTMVRELVVYVPEEEEEASDGTVVMSASTEKGQTPAGATVATTKITSKISAMDPKARTATLVFENGKEETFDVRPDVDMSKYKVGQSVVFLSTEMLALDVETF